MNLKKNYRIGCLFLAVLTVMVLLFSLLPENAMAYSYSSDHVSTNLLTNGYPVQGTAGWTNEGSSLTYIVEDGVGKLACSSYSDNLKASQIVYLSSNDIARASLNQLKIKAEGKFWQQTSSTMKAHLILTFYNAAGTQVGNEDISYDKYTVGGGNRTLSCDYFNVPAGSSYIKVTISNNNSLAGRPSVYNIGVYLTDETAPFYIATYPVTSPNKYKVGTKIRYQVQFTEPVIVSQSGYVKFKVGTQEFNTNSVYAGQSADLTTLYYDFTLPSTTALGDNLTVSVTGLSGISVKDDALNDLTLNQNLSLSNGFYVDNKPPQVSSFTTTASTNALYKAGETLQFDVTFHENIWVNGTPNINLNNGKRATYIKQTTSDTKIASFYYTIQSGEDKKNIEITSIDFSGINDSVLNTATTSPIYSTSAYNTFMSNKYVSIDTTAPTVSFAVAPTGWQKAFDIVLSPSDNISGVKEIYSAWTSVSGTPTFPVAANVDTTTNKVLLPQSSGIYDLHIKVVDQVGNSGTQKSSYQYYFDFDKPVISVSATKVAGTELVSSVTASAEDIHSGLADLTYSWINESNATVLFGNVSDGISNPTIDGLYSILIQAVDKVGNTATQTLENLAVDSIAPSVSFDVSSGVIYQKSYTVHATVTDEKSGVDKYYYMWNNSASKPDLNSTDWILATSDEFKTMEGISGTYYLHIKANDKIGNQSVISTDGFNIDNSAPTVAITPNGNENSLGEKSCDVMINISDEISPFNDITKQYAVSESETIPDTLLELTNISLTIDTTKTTKFLYIVATDIAGNKVLFKSQPFSPDLIAPTGTITKEADVYYTNSNSVNVKLDASDNYSDEIYMQIKIDENEEQWEELIAQKTITFSATEIEHVVSVRYKDKSNNISEYSSVKYYYDSTQPEITVSYSTNKLTNESVVVTATAKDNHSKAIFKTEETKTFEVNGSFEFIVVDEAGNVAKNTAVVDFIDKTKPTIQFTSEEFDGKPHQDAKMKISAFDENGVTDLSYAVVKNSDDPMEFTSCEQDEVIEIRSLDGIYLVYAKATDMAGNIVILSSQNIYFDNTTPVPTVTYEPSSRTARDVLATIRFNEEATVINNLGSTQYLFTENNSFVFTFKDEAGNEGSFTARVDWIDRNQPTAKVLLSADGWTKDEITVTLLPQPNSIIRNVKFNGNEISETDMNTYVLQEYGTLTYEIYDIQTEITSSDEVLIKIDKIAPKVSNIEYSTKSWTNQDVLVSVTATDDLSSVSYPNGSKYTFTENGSYDFVIKDSAGNQTLERVIVDWIDKKTPIPTITYYVDGEVHDSSKPVNKNVVAKIAFDAGGSPVSITNNSGKSEYEFSNNGAFNFMFADAAGNIGSVEAVITKIDKVPPTAYISYSYLGWTNKDVVATLHASDDANEIIILNNTDENYTFTQNGTFTYQFKDSAGNTGTATATVSKIDKIAPVLSYQLSTNKFTPFNVYVFVTADESVTIINNEGKTSKEFSSNGEYTFIAQDRAGNISKITAVVSNISKASTPVKLSYSTKDPTNQDVYVTIEPEDGTSYIFMTNNNGQKIKKFTENGEFKFTYKNSAGIEGEAVASVSNIDKTLPTVSVSYSHNQVTKENITASFSADEEVTYPYLIVNGKYIFTENKKLQIPVKDKVGNTSQVIIETNFIDKTAPIIQMDKQYEVLEVGKAFDPKVGITVTDNDKLSGDVVISGTYDLKTVGDYVITYTATDMAGNVTVMNKYLVVYDPNKFNVTINGRMASAGQINTDSRNIKIETIHSVGRVKVKMLTGKKNIGDFKTKGQLIDLESQFPSEGYYTLYVSDNERNSKIIYVFVAE